MSSRLNRIAPKRSRMSNRAPTRCAPWAYPTPKRRRRQRARLQIPLLAPVAGEIVERLVGPGQLLQAGATQCFTISDTSTVWVLVNVYQSDLGSVRIGDAVDITTDAYPEVFRGRISYLAPALDPTTRTLQARIVTENAGHKLKKDMYVTATVRAGAVANALLVPDAAVLRDDENMPFVYVQTGVESIRTPSGNPWRFVRRPHSDYQRPQRWRARGGRRQPLRAVPKLSATLSGG